MGFSTYYAHLRMEVATESEVMSNLVFMKKPPYNGPETRRSFVMTKHDKTRQKYFCLVMTKNSFCRKMTK